MMNHGITWAVVNQSQSPAFQGLLESLSRDLGPCWLYTGSPHATHSPVLHVQGGPRYGRGSWAERAWTWLSFTACAAKRVALLRPRPFLLFVTNPPFLPLVGWLGHELRGLRYALLIWDIYPDHVVQAGVLPAQHFAVRGWRALNRQALLAAEQVITIGDVMARTIEAQLDGKALRRPIRVIPNWADPDGIRPIPKSENALAEQYGQRDRLTVMYSGNMGATHQLGGLLAAARQLERESNASFILMGDGLGRPGLEAELQRHQLSNVRIVDSQPWDAFAKAIALADVSVVSQTSGSEHLSLPSKTYSSLAAGSAILALTSPGSDLGQLVTSEYVGKVAPPDDPVAIAAAIHELASDAGELAQMRQNARRLALERFNPDRVREMWHDALAPLIADGGAHGLAGVT